eukprot:c23235_g1_i1.p1 GENE.c23235_g1_i1~~c23235_g1_i1.p1  ORF type:complete len:336 (+),score=91.34 c23235_g1_i1:258-1265(+)
MLRSIFSSSEIKQKYEIKEVLGTGNFAEVRLGVNKQTGEKVAIKIIEPKDTDDEKIIRSEIEIMGKIEHPNVVRLIEVFEQSSKIKKSKKMFIIMELVTGGELFDRIVKKKTFKEKEARQVIRTIVETLSFVHARGIVHRDLKPENILYANERDDSPIKIADFGLAKLYNPDSADSDDKNLHTMCGTPGYVAPEILRPKDKKKGYNEQVDIWSTGVILYILLCGFPPFYEEDQDTLFRTIVKGKYDFPSPYWDNITPEAIDLVKKCLQVDPHVRITPEKALQHPWLVVADSHFGSHEIETHNLKKYIRKAKFKKVKNAILAVGRLQLALKMSVGE